MFFPCGGKEGPFGSTPLRLRMTIHKNGTTLRNRGVEGHPFRRSRSGHTKMRSSRQPSRRQECPRHRERRVAKSCDVDKERRSLRMLLEAFGKKVLKPQRSQGKARKIANECSHLHGLRLNLDRFGGCGTAAKFTKQARPAFFCLA